MCLLNAEVRYADSVALHDINLSIRQGEKIALIGRSGAGKSTLLRLIYETVPEKTALVPQDEGLVESLSVFHNVYMGQLNQHSAFYNLLNLVWPFKQRVADVNLILEKLSLQEKCFAPVNQLSGGQRQRTAVARSLYQGGELLLADEPVSAVDEVQAQRILKVLSDQFSTLVISLHDTQQALATCDRIVGLQAGTVVLDKPSGDVTPADLALLYLD